MSPPRGAGLGVAVGAGEAPGAPGAPVGHLLPRLAVSTDVPFPDTPFKRNRTSVRPASFTRSCLGIHPRGSALVSCSFVWLSSRPSGGPATSLSARQLTDARPAPSLGHPNECRCGHWCARPCGCVFVCLCPCRLWHWHPGSPRVVHSGPFTVAPGVEAGLVTEPCVSTGPVPALRSHPRHQRTQEPEL